MRNQGIIEKVEGSTPLIAIPKKGGDVRLVLDMRVPNQALTRRQVQIPTVDEILQKMEGATIFSEVHSYIEEHIKQLDQLLGTLQNNGITLKLPKCFFGVCEINVFGHIVSGEGIHPDNKIEAVINAPRPKCASEVRSCLGLTNYCSRYIPDYSSTTYPLCQLTKITNSFYWGKEQEESFTKLKQALASPQILAHYSLTAPIRLVVNASPWALGAVLLQQQPDSTYRPISYGSRSLTEVEMKYAQLKKESLAIVFGCEHFHQYLYGRNFELETDHRPLEHIFKPKINFQGKSSPARVERWVLRLQEYDFKVVYRPGKHNLADSLTRLPTKLPRSNIEACADRYVHYMSSS